MKKIKIHYFVIKEQFFLQVLRSAGKNPNNGIIPIQHDKLNNLNLTINLNFKYFFFLILS